jgi:hypothetical protein
MTPGPSTASTSTSTLVLPSPSTTSHEAITTSTDDSVRQKKCASCHSNNFLKLCPKGMCSVCCPKVHFLSSSLSILVFTNNYGI